MTRMALSGYRNDTKSDSPFRSRTKPMDINVTKACSAWVVALHGGRILIENFEARVGASKDK